MALFIDIIGYIAIVLSVIGFASKDTINMRIYGMFSTLLFGISIYFYNGVNGLFVSVISFFTKWLSFYFPEKYLMILKFLSPIIALIYFLYFNKEGLIGLLPSLSLIFIIVADLQKNIVNMKIIYYGSIVCWLWYGIVLDSIPAILFDVFGFIFLTYGIIKLKK